MDNTTSKFNASTSLIILLFCSLILFRCICLFLFCYIHLLLFRYISFSLIDLAIELLPQDFELLPFLQVNK